MHEEPDRPIEEVLEELVADVPEEDWDRVPPSDFDALTVWEKLAAEKHRPRGDALLTWACALMLAGGVGIVIAAIAWLIIRWTG